MTGKKTCIGALLLLLPLLAWPQEPGTLVAVTKIPLANVEQLVMPAVDNASLREEELARRRPGAAPRFATTFPVNATPETRGAWEQVSPTEAVWRLRVLSRGAYSLNLGFTEYHMPEGGALILYSPDRQRVMGPFTPADNEDHAQLWTPVFDGDALVVEVRLPIARRNELRLRLSAVNHDFLDFRGLLSGACNLDVACGARDGWPIVDRYRDAIRSVGIYGFGGDSFCTGFLINNTRQDCTPYFMTAYHCGVNVNNAPSVIVYWNYQNSACRPLGSPANGNAGDGKLNNFNLGARYRAGYAPSDFALLELDDPVSATADAYFAGWSARPELPTDTLACVHHPGSDEKRISFAFSNAFRGVWGRGAEPVADGNHLVIPRWDIGTTETGSSGGPLFDRHHRVVGQLHGGLAACGNTLFDQFGWLAVSWTGGGAPASSLRPWLDPDSSGVLTLDGRPQSACNYVFDPDQETASVCLPGVATFTLRSSPLLSRPLRFTVRGLPPGATAAFSPNPVPPGGVTLLRVALDANTAPGDYPLAVEATDGQTTTPAFLTLIADGGPPPPPQPEVPADGETEVNTAIAFHWTRPPTGAHVQFQLAADPGFLTVLADADSLTVNTYRPPLLAGASTYYWRVRAVNACGASPWSAAAAFSTANIRCDTWLARQSPVEIPSLGTPTVVSSIDIDAPGSVVGVRVLDLDISHTFVGDLKVSLTAPSGKSITLFDRPGYPDLFFGCDGDDLLLSFADNAPRSYQQLESTCRGAPAISGAFQPADPLAAFHGEQAAGAWKLTIRDNNNQDGGRLNRWRLELCVALPKDLSLKAPDTRPDACVNTPYSFDLTLGTGFNKNGVTLSAAGLPPGAGATFTPNPAPPGASVTATVHNLTTPGGFPLTIQASDGSETTTVVVDVIVQGPPGTSTLLLPANGAGAVPRQPLLRWRAANGASRYLLRLSTRPDLASPLVTQLTTDTFFLVGGLDFLSTYYWRVEALNECNQRVASAVFSFRTEPDVSLFLSTGALRACPAEEPSFLISVGNSYNRPRLSYAVSPPAPLRITFDPDTSTLAGGDVVRATLRDLPAAAAGQYTITITVADGVYQGTGAIVLSLLPATGVPRRLSPADDATIGTPTPALLWSAAAHADSYLLEIARDTGFTNLLRSLPVADTTFTLVNPLPPGRYYWRVIARGRCGDVASGAGVFSVLTTSTDRLGNSRVRVFPNPARDLLHVAFEGAPPPPLTIDLFAADGRLLRRWSERTGAILTLDLSPYPAGVYMLRLLSAKGELMRRVVRQD